MQKNIQQRESDVCAKFKEKTVEWNCSDLEISILFSLSKIYSKEFFQVFPVSSSVCSKKYFH